MPPKDPKCLQLLAFVDPLSEAAQKMAPLIEVLYKTTSINVTIILNPVKKVMELPAKRCVCVCVCVRVRVCMHVCVCVCYHAHSFIYNTNISQISSMVNTHDFYFHEVDKIASESSYKTLELWEIHKFIFMNASKN